MERRSFLVSAMAASALAFTGCVTNRLLDSGGHYSEEISTLFITKDGKKLVAVTQNYHYIFDAPEVVVMTLQKNFHKFVSAEFSGFSVSENEAVSGTLDLTLTGATEIETTSALASGFKQYSNSVSARCKLIGKRYKANDIIPTEKYKLNKTYTVMVDAPVSSAEKAAKILVSPITLAVDGALLLFGIPLFFIVMGAACKKGCS